MLKLTKVSKIRILSKPMSRSYSKNPNELIKNIESLCKNTNNSNEAINQVNELLKNNQKELLKNNQKEIVSYIGAGLFVTLYCIAMVATFILIFEFIDINPLISFVCLVLFVTLLLPTLA